MAHLRCRPWAAGSVRYLIVCFVLMRNNDTRRRRIDPNCQGGRRCRTRGARHAGYPAMNAIRFVEAQELRANVGFEDLIEPVSMAFQETSAGLVARALAPQTVRSTTVLGSGVQAYWQPQALYGERQFETVRRRSGCMRSRWDAICARQTECFGGNHTPLLCCRRSAGRRDDRVAGNGPEKACVIPLHLFNDRAELDRVAARVRRGHGTTARSRPDPGSRGNSQLRRSSG